MTDTAGTTNTTADLRLPPGPLKKRKKGKKGGKKKGSKA
jgi:hypothetical protein